MTWGMVPGGSRDRRILQCGGCRCGAARHGRVKWRTSTAQDPFCFMRIADIRQEYMRAGLVEKDAAADPFKQFDRWFHDALHAQLPLPNAMTLATATAAGRRSARGSGGGKRHRVGQRQLRVQRIVKPAIELLERIGRGVFFDEPGAHVFLAYVGDAHEAERILSGAGAPFYPAVPRCAASVSAAL